ncbi:unnamed protein product [Cunninghamella blakesleeana]
MTISRLILLILACLQLIGLSIFLKGFLLTRQTLSQQGKTYHVWDSFPITLSDNDSEKDSSTFILPSAIKSPEAFKRVIIVVVDALRFDFMIKDATQNEYYRNKLPIIDQLLNTQPDHTLLYQFQADPPTTTMQRIKGLMTGSLPTFIDAGDNFASSAVQEDHLLFHLSKKYPKLYFMGDNTWEQLFPSVLSPERTFASDSFKMFDLYTVDNRIQEQLWPLLENKSNKKHVKKGNADDDWDVIITHFLGVDHCGHTYGPNHSNMATKLDEINSILSRLIQNHVNNDTLLVVMGDHGMSTEGDHGGESIEELMSGILFYSGRELTIKKQQRNGHHHHPANQLYFNQLIEKIYNARKSILGHDVNKITERLLYNATEYSIVPQINLVPTLSYLLQIPIPFGNLGALIPEVLLYTNNKDSNQLDVLLHMAQQYRLNALQVYDYLITYGNQTHNIGFTKVALSPLLQQLEKAEKSLLKAIQLDDDAKLYMDYLESTILDYDAFLSNTIKYCEGIWAQFDVGSILLGVFILFSSTLAAIFIWMNHDGWSQIQLKQWKQYFVSFISTFWVQVVMCGITLCIAIIWITLPQLHTNPSLHGAFEKIEWMDVILSVTGIVMILFSVHIIYQYSKKSTTSVWSPINIDGIVLFIGDIIQASTLGSNSFVIWEDRGSRFIIVTLCVWWIFRNLKSSSFNNRESIFRNWTTSILPPILVMLWVRTTGLFGQCREEQFPYCDYIDINFLKTLDTKSASFWTILFFIITGITMIYLIGWMASTIRNNNNILRLPIFYVFNYGFCLLVIYIRMIEDIYLNIHEVSLLNQLEVYIQSFTTITVTKMMDVYLPRCVYSLCLIASLTLWMNKKMNRPLNDTSPFLWIFLNIWSTMFALIQRPIGSMIILITPLIIYMLSLDNNDHRLHRANKKDEHENNNDNNNTTIMVRLGILHMIGQHLFFVTGHQATFTSLPWKAAFIGFDDMYYNIGAILVTLSTFSGHFMTWIGTWILLNNYKQQKITTNYSHSHNHNHNDDGHFLIYLATLQSIPTCLSSLFVFILRRHLMTWKIFAPRFLLQAITVVALLTNYQNNGNNYTNNNIPSTGSSNANRPNTTFLNNSFFKHLSSLTLRSHQLIETLINLIHHHKVHRNNVHKTIKSIHRLTIYDLQGADNQPLYLFDLLEFFTGLDSLQLDYQIVTDIEGLNDQSMNNGMNRSNIINNHLHHLIKEKLGLSTDGNRNGETDLPESIDTIHINMQDLSVNMISITDIRINPWNGTTRYIERLVKKITVNHSLTENPITYHYVSPLRHSDQYYRLLTTFYRNNPFSIHWTLLILSSN